MGGRNSGYPIWMERKNTVEQCLHLDASRLGLRRHVGRKSTGDIAWTDPRTGIKMAGVDLVLDLRTSYEPAAFVSFRIAELEIVRTQKIPLVSYRPYFGGRHWFFECPTCGEEGLTPLRVRKLYLPLDGGTAFGCQRCHDLTYDSAQDSHRFDRLFRDITKEVLGTDSASMASQTMRNILSRSRVC